MNKHLVKYALKDGKSIVVEVETPEADFERIANLPGAVEQSARSFEESVADIEPATNAVLNMLKNLGIAEGQIEVGLKFSARAGVILASADSEATFKITMKWKS